MQLDFDPKVTFQRFSSTIQELLDQPSFVFADTEKLKELFFQHLAEVFQIAFDLQIPVNDIERFFSKVNQSKDNEEDAVFLAGVLENDKTYILLNYFCYEFIRAYLDVTKEEYKEKVEKILVEKNISENDIQTVLEQYKTYSQPTSQAAHLH